MSRLPSLGPWGRRGLVLVVTALLVVAGTAALAVTSYPSSSEVAEAGHPEYDPASLAVDHRTADVGARALPEPADEPGIVLIDTTHVNRQDQELLRSLVSAITATGYEVRFLRRSANLDDELARADAFVVIDPATSFSDDEIQTVTEFVDDGGRLAIIGEPTRGQIQFGFGGAVLIDVQSRVHTLAGAFGIQFETEDLYAVESGDGNFRNVKASGVGDHPLAEGVDEATLYTATSVRVEGDGEVFLRSDAGTTITGSDEAGQFPVGVVSGNVVAIGDKTFLEANKYTVADNDRIVANLAAFLAGGDHQQDLDDYPYNLAGESTVRFTDESFYERAQDVANDLREAGGSPTVSHEPDRISRGGPDVLVTSFEYLRTHKLRGVDITVENGTVSVPGYQSSTDDVAVVMVPESGFDLVIAADSPEAAADALAALRRQQIDQFLLTEDVAVVTGPPAFDTGTGGGGGGSGGGGGVPPFPGSTDMTTPTLDPVTRATA